MARIPRVDVPHAATELETLDAMLHYGQEAVLVKIEGLCEADLRRPLMLSGTILLGMINHLDYAHRWWFRIVFANEDGAVPWTPADPAADWRVDANAPYARVMAFYHAEITYAHALTVAATPDMRSQRPGTDFSLRWILTYMIHETAWHLGQADCMSELIDGRTGR